MSNESSMNKALRVFEATEANLIKLEKLWKEIESAIPQGQIFITEDEDYENNCRSFETILEALPKIDDWKPVGILLTLAEIVQLKIDAKEVGEIECIMSVENHINFPGKELREYRYKFDQKRRQLIRDSLVALIDTIDSNLRELSKVFNQDAKLSDEVIALDFDELKNNIAQINGLLGSSISRPSRWSDLLRHSHFGLVGDLRDIIEHDWPNVKNGINSSLYGEKEAIQVEVEDLASLVKSQPKGPIATKLNWETLSDEEFERVIYALISSSKGYENPQWLTKTNAPDKGRDLSVMRVYDDSLRGRISHRVIIQCKHWLTKSVSIDHISSLTAQMQLWEPPKVDVCAIATSGRFTTDAIQFIEKHNQGNSSLQIEMWPESELERLLAARPDIIAEFHLR